MRRRFRIVLEAFLAIHHFIHFLVFIFTLIYSVLTVLTITPLYINLSVSLGIPSWLLLIFIYLLVAIVIISLWWWQVQRSGGRNVPRIWKWCYRQTDRTGTLFLDAIVMFAAVSCMVSVILYFRNVYLIEPTIFLSILALFSTFLDVLPIQRPRRAVVPLHGNSLRDIANRLAQAQQVAPEHYLGLLVNYNRLDRYYDPDNGPYKGPDETLPDGMIIEIPPWIPPERLGGNP